MGVSLRRGHFQIGSDPEFFVVSKRYGNILSAHRLEKHLPITYNDENPSGFARRDVGEIKRDGAALEVNPSPTTCRDDQVPFFFFALRSMQRLLESEKKDKGFKLSGRTVHNLSKASLKNAPEDVLEFGCNPDFNAYTLEEQSPVCPVGSLRRFAGGHIHSSTHYGYYPEEEDAYNINNPLSFADLAIAYDVLIGFPAVGILGAKYAEDEIERRQFYGKAGSYRISTNNTFEYRVLSNTAFALSPILMSMWLGIAKHFPKVPSEVTKFLKDVDNVIGIGEIQRAINEHDYEFVWENYAKWVEIYPKNILRFLPSNVAHLFKASQDGEIWDDDILFNWGVGFEGFEARHHGYWGHENATMGRFSKLIYPGSITIEAEKILNSYTFTGTSTNTDNNYVKYHPAEDAPKVKRSWER